MLLIIHQQLYLFNEEKKIQKQIKWFYVNSKYHYEDFPPKMEIECKTNFFTVKICKLCCIEIKSYMNQFKLLHVTLLIIEK